MLVIIRRSPKIKTSALRDRLLFTPVCGFVATSCGSTVIRNFSAYQNKIINMSKDYVSEIPVFTRKNVHIKDRVKLNKLLNSIIAGGVDNLQIVFDFDRTLTKQHEDGKEFLSSFGLFRHCPSITKEYVETENRLTSIYYPIEISPSISMEEKKKKMVEWWSESMKSFKGLKVPKSELDEVAAKYSPSLRDGTEELFADLNKNNIPVLVFSAGVGDVIMSVLKYYKVNYPVVKVVSNFLNYSGDSDEILGFIGKPIDIFSKNEFALKGTEHYKLIENRDNVILLGDSIGDAGMADGMPHCNSVLKIGFLYDHITENLPKYMDTFDIVLEDDQTMVVIRSILKYLF